MTSSGRGSGPQVAPRGALIGLGLVVLVFAAFSQFKLPVVLPLLLDRYAYDPVLAGGFMSVYAVLGIALSLWIGRRVEARGPLNLILLALPLMAGGTLVSLAAPQLGGVVLLGRALEGAAFAILAVAGPVLATSLVSERHRNLVVGLVAAWMPAGQLLAAVLAPFALATTGWTGLWLASVAMALGLIVWAWHLRGKGSMAAGPAGAQTQAAAPGAGGPPRAPWTRGQKQALWLTAGVFMLWSGQYLAYMTWLPEYLVGALGLTVEEALWVYLIPIVLVGIFNVLSGLVLRRGLAVERLLLGAVTVQALLWWLLPVSSSGLAGLLSLCLYGITAGIVPTCLFTLPTEAVRNTGQRARAFGSVMTGRNLGVFLGPLLLAQLVKWSGDWVASSPAFAVLTSLAAVLSLLLLFVMPGLRGTGQTGLAASKPETP
ncbi:MFS transporter [Pelagibius sp.]|uniref:MFS transporter n=1 Tax=Pelagibius sp. TaxID=1931238 RepID=UPI002610DC04|nr:MFS transporter [Pelagibius sp.]